LWESNNLGTLTVLLSFSIMLVKAQEVAQWPQITSTTKPWTRWWWMGNAVDFENIKKSLIEFKEAGIGGVEISPIYGVKGEEANGWRCH
jgi:hypothetical protein